MWYTRSVVLFHTSTQTETGSGGGSGQKTRLATGARSIPLTLQHEDDYETHSAERIGLSLAPAGERGLFENTTTGQSGAQKHEWHKSSDSFVPFAFSDRSSRFRFLLSSFTKHAGAAG
jgi:hypothetical protein